MSSKNKKLNLDKETLYDLYANQQMTSEEIAKIFNCTSKSIRNYLINTAIDNNLKLLLIYPKNNSYLIKNGTIKNLGHIDIIDINDID